MYLDTAIVVKLLVRETDSAWFNDQLAGHSFETSELALTEVRAALLSKERSGQITPRERAQAIEKFQQWLDDELLLLFPLNRTVLDRASGIQVACHPQIPLRTLDALHVATCDLNQSGILCTTDHRMRAACGQLGISLVPTAGESPK